MFLIFFNVLFINLLSFSSFCSIPFIAEFLIGFISLFFLVFCSFKTVIKKDWSYMPLLWYYKIVKFSFIIIIIINIFLIKNILYIENGLFFGNYFMNDFFGVVIKVFLIFICWFIYSQYQRYIIRNNFQLVSVLDYPVCILGLTFFLLLLISVYDILCMAFLIMGMSICLYGLFIQNTIFNQISREVCIKYFILSAGSTLLILGGCLYLFYFCGTVNFLYINNFLIYKVLMVENILDLELIKRGILLIFIGFLFKLSIAPAHFWAPEIYAGIPSALLAIILLPIKFIIGIIFLRVFRVVLHIFALNSYCNYLLFDELEFLIIFVSILSMVFGGVNAVFEQNLKRFIAYSSINQIGFLIIGLLGFESSIFSLQIYIYFLFVYILNIGIFLFFIFWCERLVFYENVLNIETQKYELLKQTKPLIFITDLKVFVDSNILIPIYISKSAVEFIYGTFIKSPLLDTCFYFNYSKFMFLLFILSLLSLAGIPPFIGFFTKFYILLYTIKLKYYILTIFGLWISLISAYYYLRILKLIFLEESNYSFLTFNPIVSDIIYIYSHWWLNFEPKSKLFQILFNLINYFHLYLYIVRFHLILNKISIFLFCLLFSSLFLFDSTFLFYIEKLIYSFILLQS